MPLPRLIHPVQITIEPLDRERTHQDDLAREPVKVLRRKTQVKIQAQVSYSIAQAPEVHAVGILAHATGYLVLLIADLNRLKYKPTIGDRVAQIGRRPKPDETTAGQFAEGDTGLFIVASKPSGHYDGTPSLLFAYFSDKRPSGAAQAF